jgi:hypothetical protein
MRKRRPKGKRLRLRRGRENLRKRPRMHGRRRKEET